MLSWVLGRLTEPKPVTHLVGSQPYAIQENGTLGFPVRELAPQWTKPTLHVSTLDGLIGAIQSGLDDMPSEVALHVQDPTTVAVISMKADEFGRRHLWAQATHKEECPFQFGKYYDPEAFLLAFRASFAFNEAAVKVQRLLSTLSSESSVSVSDDGISQTVTAKVGAVTRASVELPSEIPLIYWRTFREADPVESKYMLRLKGEPGKVPLAALFEVDARWRLDTVESVARYLAAALPGAIILK